MLVQSHSCTQNAEGAEQQGSEESRPQRHVGFSETTEEHEIPRDEEAGSNFHRKALEQVANLSVLLPPWHSRRKHKKCCPGCGVNLIDQDGTECSMNSEASQASTCSSKSQDSKDKDSDSCDNALWKWNGEPPFCCMCAKERGLGSFSSLACSHCRDKRLKTLSEKASAGPIADIVGKIALLTNRAADFFCALAPRTWTWQPERL
eukprot:CAMPEP_0184289116 /NCGR_PEP_ID=MMETSP1049-20130417/1562_1 /TAXON_ID=77928 /ORGANISM="Proteomonas sulcata, Strain CCMP704" /LENGTH=204 /DNA_ID=CAMNT_0026595773 /DNA_START=426 /DNA_END=1041 /DNA_ORIENTATION=-